ncbi:MAG: hypothetical protein AAGF73_14355 [Actinomycetota bacterium]
MIPETGEMGMSISPGEIAWIVNADDAPAMRWPIERTNSWLSNYGQFRRNTDRTTELRLAQLPLAIALIITIKLIDWRNRYSPTG